jgi:F0F1-type ATP synthase assembly protein I
MKKKLIVLIVILFSLVLHAEKPKIAVMSLEDQSGKLTEKVKNAASTLLRMQLSSSGEFIVIDETRQEKVLGDMIKEMKKESYKMCYDEKCQIPLGQALSADTILRSTVTELGGLFILGVELIDLAKEAVTKAANAEFDGTESGIGEAVKKVVYNLTVKSAQESKKLKDEEEKRKAQIKLEEEKRKKEEHDLKMKKQREAEIEKRKKEDARMAAYKKELSEAGFKRKSLALTAFLSGAVLTGTGIGLLVYSDKLDVMEHDAYTNYLGSITEDEAVKHRKDVEKYRDQEKVSKIVGGILTGAGAGLILTSIITWSVDSSDEKAVKKKYNISFSLDPVSKMAFLSVNF